LLFHSAKIALKIALDKFSRGNMCRNIKTLYNFEPPATDSEIEAAALQFVRKLSGFSKPSMVNTSAFEKAIKEISSASKMLLESLETKATPKNREEEAAKAKERNRLRFAKG